MDFIPEAKEAIQTGKIDGSIAYSMRAYGKAAIVLALKTIQKHPIPKAVYSPLAVVTRENIDSYMDFK